MKLEANPEVLWQSGLNNRAILVRRINNYSGAELWLRIGEESLRLQRDALVELLRYLDEGTLT